MSIAKLEQEGFRRITERFITPKLPAEEKFQPMIAGLLTARENTHVSPARNRALTSLRKISETAATWGQKARDKEHAFQMLTQGFQPFYFPPVETDLLIELGIIQNQLTIGMVNARGEARKGRNGESAENSMVVWALDARECDLLLEEPPNTDELLTAIKSVGKPLSQVVWRGPKPLDEIIKNEEAKANSTVAKFLQTYAINRGDYSETHLVPPILALRESYTITIPSGMIPRSIMKKHHLKTEDVDGIEIDIKGVYVLGKNKKGQSDLFFLGETQTPHRHISTLGEDQRIDITDGTQLKALGEICQALKIKPREFNPTNIRATNEQVAAMLALMVHSVKYSDDFD